MGVEISLSEREKVKKKESRWKRDGNTIRHTAVKCYVFL